MTDQQISTGLLIEALSAAGYEDEANRVAVIRSHVAKQLQLQTPTSILADLAEAKDASLLAIAAKDPFPPLDLAEAIAEPPSTWKTGLRWWDDAMADGGMQESWKIVLAAGIPSQPQEGVRPVYGWRNEPTPIGREAGAARVQFARACPALRHA